MKKFLFLCSAFFCVSAFASEVTSEKILDAIDMICGDTWCSGDFDYNFQSISLNGGKAVLTYDLVANTSSNLTQSFPYVCVIEGYQSFESMLEAGDASVLAQSFYDKLNHCTGENEHDLHMKLRLGQGVLSLS